MMVAVLLLKLMVVMVINCPQHLNKTQCLSWFAVYCCGKDQSDVGKTRLLWLIPSSREARGHGRNLNTGID